MDAKPLVVTICLEINGHAEFERMPRRWFSSACWIRQKFRLCESWDPVHVVSSPNSLI